MSIRPFVAGFAWMSVVALAAMSQPVHAVGILYGSDGFTGDIIAIDTTDGTSVLVGSTGLVNALGVAYNPGADLWYTRSFDSLYTFDINTGTVTLVGPSGGFITGLAFNPDYTTLYSVNQGNGDFYTVDPATGTATLVGNTGVNTPLDLSTAADGTLWAASIGADIYTVDPATGVATLQAASVDARGLTSISFDSAGNLFGVTLSGDMLVQIDPGAGTTTDVGGPVIRADIRGMDFARGQAVAPRALFNVTKTFSDGNTAEVDVMLSCNAGLPLEQSFTIAGGDPDGVTFVVTNIPETGADCEVIEMGGPAGYSVSYNGSADGCQWEDITTGAFRCDITNTADDATYTVVKDWVIEGAGGDVINPVAQVQIICTSEIDGGNELGGGVWELRGSLGDGDTLVAKVDVSTGPAGCAASEQISQSGVESVAVGCGDITLGAGGSHTCTFTNTVFFEGIPTLSQYGLAILALLMLGVGFVGMRRFV